MSDDENFRGIILVRKDSGISKVIDLKGRAVSFPAPTALAATMMPQFYMQNNGIDVMNDIEIQYVGSQKSSIMNVFLGAIRPPVRPAAALESSVIQPWHLPGMCQKTVP